MRQLTTLICFLTVSVCLANGKSDHDSKMLLVEAEFTPILAKGAGLHFAYSFSEKWSIYAGGCLWYGNIRKGISTTEETHNNDVGGFIDNTLIYDFYKSELAVQYWPNKAFKGHYISAGIRYGNISRGDVIMEYGYRIPILKGFGISISLKTGLLSIIRKTDITSHIININIGYEF